MRAPDSRSLASRMPGAPSSAAARVGGIAAPGLAILGLAILGLAILGLAILGLSASSVAARERAFFEAKRGLDVAQAAARSWSPDAILVYLENDEDVNAAGGAERWGYLYYSPGREVSRIYSVRDGRVLVAENLQMRFDAPPLAAGWLDSGAAVAAAEAGPGGAFRREEQGRLATMLLMRGAFHGGDPNQTTWTLIYTSPRSPSLFVVVDALEGKVRRTWRG